MRDLKPDNLLVAGDPKDYPNFLSSAKSYAIGLIDLETAVDYKGGSHLSILQPQLGGTPYYGTPSHFFLNRLLDEVHNDLALIFHLQDWYAVVGIIYEVITGEILFQRTAREIPKQIKIAMQTASQKGDLKSAYYQFCLRFWESSATEFHNCMQSRAQWLTTVMAGIPEIIQRRLADYIQMEQSNSERRIKACLDSNTAFNKGNNRRRLEQGTVADLERLRSRYEGRKNAENLVNQMDDLIGQKQKIEKLAQQSKSLEKPSPEVNAKTLLEMMFAVVHINMLPEIPAEIPEEISQMSQAEDQEPGVMDATARMDEHVEGMTDTDQGLGYSVTVTIG
jgi:hypothetical protein